jgi:hypothetical protein
MNPAVVTTLATDAGLLVALWLMLEHFDKRNADRFRALERRMDELRDALQKQIEDLKDSVRAEMR